MAKDIVDTKFTPLCGLFDSRKNQINILISAVNGLW